MAIKHNPDILLCLANLSNDEVFTSPKLANQILDMLPDDIWKDKNATFLDPVCKTGVFLREIAVRLDKGLSDIIKDKQERINHIFTKQIFGIAVTELTALISRRTVYCAKVANSKFSVCSAFPKGKSGEDGNIKYSKIEHSWKDNKCTFCGASKEVFDKENIKEKHAYQFIHTDKPEGIHNKMKFDVIIGNPPYQLDTGGSGKQAKPIYNLFINQAKKLNPKYITMIIPSRWFAGGMGLNEFREEMLNDKRIKYLEDFVDAGECFPSVDIAGGVCYFLWDRDYNGACEISSHLKGTVKHSKRYLNEFETFVRFSQAVSILNKINKIKEHKLTDIISATRPFGLKTSDRPSDKGGLILLSSGGTGKIEKNKVTSGFDMINKWKLITSKTSHDHAGQPDKDGMRRVLSRIEILAPKYVCTESYIVLGAFDSCIEAQNLESYVKTKFVRFVISLLSFSQDITRERFAYVPIQDFNEEWTDSKLYKKYKLTKEEIDFIESMIRPMELTKDLDNTEATND